MVKEKGEKQVRAKTLPYPAVVAQGLIKEGDVLRYITKHGELLGIGVARERGIQLNPKDKPVGTTAFEAACGSKAHRPNEFTLLPDSLTMQETIARHLLGDDGVRAAKVKGTTARLQLAAQKAAEKAAKAAEKAAKVAEKAAKEAERFQPFTDGMDDECKLCGQGGTLLCCEVCPSVYHPSCIGLPGIPEGDWHCPACRCARCGVGGLGEPLQLLPRGAPVAAPEGSVPWPTAASASTAAAPGVASPAATAAAAAVVDAAGPSTSGASPVMKKESPRLAHQPHCHQQLLREGAAATAAAAAAAHAAAAQAAMPVSVKKREPAAAVGTGAQPMQQDEGDGKQQQQGQQEGQEQGQQEGQQQEGGAYAPPPPRQRPLVHLPNHEEAAYQRALESQRAAAVAAPGAKLEPPLPIPAIPEGLQAEEPRAPPPADARQVACPGSGVRVHAGCLRPEELALAGTAASAAAAAAAAGATAGDAAAGAGGDGVAAAGSAAAAMAVDGVHGVGVGTTGVATEPWFASEDARRASSHLAGVCAAGPQAVPGCDAGGAALSWQLIRGAAVRSPQSCGGYYPAYSPAQRAWLRSVLSAALAVLQSGLPPARDAHSGREVLPLLLMGWPGAAAMGGPSAGFDGFHTAVLWAGGTVAAAAAVRVAGTGEGIAKEGSAASSAAGAPTATTAALVAEVPFLAVRPELRCNGLGSLLLRCVEGCCLAAGAGLVLTPAPVPMVPPAPDAPPGAPLTYAALNYSWAHRRGYRTATPAQRLAANMAGVLFPLRAPLAVKNLSPATLVGAAAEAGGAALAAGGEEGDGAVVAGDAAEEVAAVGEAASVPWEGLLQGGPLVMHEPPRTLPRLAREATALYAPPLGALAAAAEARAVAEAAAGVCVEIAVLGPSGIGGEGEGDDAAGGAGAVSVVISPRALNKTSAAGERGGEEGAMDIDGGVGSGGGLFGGGKEGGPSSMDVDAGLAPAVKAEDGAEGATGVKAEDS